MKMTRELLDASLRLTNPSAFLGVDRTRIGLVDDIRQRAREIGQACIPEGSELRRPQIEVLQQLRSRLQDFCLVTFTASTEWLDAFSDAYNR